MLVALLAAVCFATAVVFQQEAAVTAAAAGGEARGIARLAIAVVRRRAWLLATLVDFAGFLLQATALHLGRVTVVQPLLVLVLLFGMLLGAWRSGIRLAASDLAGALMLCLGLAGFLFAALPNSAGTSSVPEHNRLPGLVAAVLVLAGVGVAVATRLGPAPAAIVQALVAGTCFAGVAAIVKTVGQQLTSDGPLHVLATWQVYALAIVAISGLAIEQTAFAGGPLVPTLVVLTLIDPLASVCSGALVYGESLRGGVGPVLGSVVSALVVAAGVLLVARSRATAEVQSPAAIAAHAEEARAR